jgi:hypothetical protein
MPKPSPLASIFMFAGSVLLLWGIFSSSWFSMDFGGDSFSFGLVRGEECFNGECRSRSIFSGRMGGHGLFALLIWAISFGGIVCAVIAGFFLFKPGRSALAVVAMSLVAGAVLFALFFILVVAKARGFSYGIPVFLLGSGGIITGSIMAMMRPRPPMQHPPMGYRPMMGMPMGNPYGAPMGNPYGPPLVPPMANPYAPPPQAPPQQGPSPYAPRPAVDASAAPTQGAPCQTCQTPTTWVAQYNRWFCTRCQKYS